MAEKSLKDKCVVITGGASGIGYAIADNFLKKGAGQVALLDLNPKVGAESVKTLTEKYGEKATFFKCDVTNETEMEQVFEELLKKYKRIDVLVNNAGILDETNWKKCIDVNLTYLIGCSLKFWEHMRKDKSGKGGTIFNVASIYGYRVDQYLPVYSASKFGVMGFTKTLGHQYNWNRTGVRVIALCPGFTSTALSSPESFKFLKDERLYDDFDKFLGENLWQTVECVGIAAVEAFEESDSGKAWSVEGGQPIYES